MSLKVFKDNVRELIKNKEREREREKFKQERTTQTQNIHKCPLAKSLL